MPPRQFPAAFVYPLILLCGAGWFVAWRKSGELSTERQAAQLNGTGAGNKLTERQARDRLVADTIHNPRSARLFTQLAQISADAKPGVVNQALIDACRATLLDNDPETRRRDFSLLMEQMRPEDAPAMHEAFLALHREGRPFIEYTTFATRWGEVDGEGAMKYLLGQTPLVFPERDFEAIARGWATRDPQSALAWAKAHPQETLELGGEGPMLEGWIRCDPEAATRYLTQEKQLNEQDAISAIAGGFHEQMRGPGPAAALSWLSALPDDPGFSTGALMGWNNSVWDLCELPYADAADAWAKVGDKGWMGFDQFREFADMVGQSRSAAGKGAEGFLNELPGHWPQEKMAARFDQWAEQSPAGISGWVEGMDPSPVRDTAIRSLIRATQESDPATAEKWRAVLEGK